MNCLQGFHQEISRDEHRNYCLDNEAVKVELPHKQPRVEFCDEQYQFKVPFIIYADFKSLLEPIQGPGLNPTGPWTTETSNHIPSDWCTYSKFAYGKVEDPLTLYRGKDCVNPILPGEGGGMFFFHHPETAQAMKLKRFDYKNTSVRHILQVIPGCYILRCYQWQQNYKRYLAKFDSIEK